MHSNRGCKNPAEKNHSLLHQVNNGYFLLKEEDDNFLRDWYTSAKYHPIHHILWRYMA